MQRISVPTSARTTCSDELQLTRAALIRYDPAAMPASRIAGSLSPTTPCSSSSPSWMPTQRAHSRWPSSAGSGASPSPPCTAKERYQEHYDAWVGSRNGFSVITARSGLGKSHAVGRFLDSVDASSHIAAYLAPGFATTPEFYRMLCIQFKLDPTGNKQRMLNASSITCTAAISGTSLP